MSEESSQAQAFEALALKALALLDEALERCDPENVVGLVKLAGALVDLHAVLGLKKDPLDQEEQRAKIQKLQQDAHQDKAQGGGVILLPEIREPEEDPGEDPPCLDPWLEHIRQP